MKKPIATIVVQNPALAAAFTPIFAVLPTTQINLTRHLSSTAQAWVIGLFIALMLTALIVMINVCKKKVELTLQEDRLELYKKTYPLDEIVLMRYNPRNRYLQVKSSRSMRSFNVYLGKKEEAIEKVATLQQWATQVGANFQS